jgi:hypothetical protein
MSIHHILAIVKNPKLNILVGLAMAGSAAFEVIEPFLSGDAASLGAEHGMVLFGLVHTAKSLVELFEGMEKIEGAVEQE